MATRSYALMDSKDKTEQKLKYMHHNPLQEKWNLAKYPEDYKWSSAILQYWHRQFRVSYTLYGTFWIVPVSVPQTGEQEKWLFNDRNKKP